MREKERIEKVLEQRQRKGIRKQNKIQYFKWFASKRHLPWVHRMVETFKEQGKYPLIPCRELAMRYADVRDKEIAAFMGFAVRYNGEYSVIKEAMDELGERPWEWFVNRGFVRLSVGDMQDQKTCGQTNWKIAQMFHNLNKVYVHSECPTLGEAVLTACRQTLSPLDQYMERLFKDCCIKQDDDELHTLILVLSHADGVGLSVWTISPHDVRCPLTKDVKAFLGYWWPNWRVDVTINECPGCFGLSDGDLYIAAVAYARLRELNPFECAYYERRYANSFKQGTMPDYRGWNKCQQPIEFVF